MKEHCNWCSTFGDVEVMNLKEGQVRVCMHCNPFAQVIADKPLPITIADF